MWLYQRKMPWEKGERKPFVSMAIKVQPRIAPPASPPSPKEPEAPEPPPQPSAPPPAAATAPGGSRRRIKPMSAPLQVVTPPKKPRRRRRRPKGPATPKPIAESTEKPKGSAPLLAASFPDLEATTKKEMPPPPELAASFPGMEAATKKEMPRPDKKGGAIGAPGSDEARDDPLLSDSYGDEWAASDSFREKRRELTQRHEDAQRKQLQSMEEIGEDESATKDLMSDASRSDEWAPSDSGRIAPLRELQGLGAHDEDQFEDEEEEGLGTRILAREADDMERDAVDEEFFSDIDMSDEEYAKAARSSSGGEGLGTRVVRKLEETQFLDYKELDSRFMLTDSIIEADEDGEKGPSPEEDDVDDGSPKAKELSDSDFAGALSRLPSQRLVRFIESVSAGKALPAEPVSKEEFQALFGSET